MHCHLFNFIFTSVRWPYLADFLCHFSATVFHWIQSIRARRIQPRLASASESILETGNVSIQSISAESLLYVIRNSCSIKVGRNASTCCQHPQFLIESVDHRLVTISRFMLTLILQTASNLRLAAIISLQYAYLDKGPHGTRR